MKEDLSAMLPLAPAALHIQSEEHTSELQSRLHLVCRLLLEKKKKAARQWPPGALINRLPVDERWLTRARDHHCSRDGIRHEERRAPRTRSRYRIATRSVRFRKSEHYVTVPSERRLRISHSCVHANPSRYGSATAYPERSAPRHTSLF